ncbi:glycoside hydrolase family 5 protein [Rhodococcus sp. MTM3W5.2]|uniref:glycoside hydrolase family 5 protein n=1 Tax=Rhodococcus sp. MTM3W5.2 TaxID=1805827 RepID=UPI001CB88AF3|nr:cellulase family glycosylhydrolase [Rhodococcus sp. MTM3W5.2]
MALTLLFAAASVQQVSAHATEPAGWTLPRLTVTDGAITDATGRTVLLRGANINQLNDYAHNEPALATTAPLERADFTGMAAQGFNVAPLTLAWSALEPTPGAFDEAYVAKIHKAVNDAKDHGIYTVLDMHQDAWGKAPAWATLTDGWSTCTLGGQRETSPAVARSFQNFYDDTQGIQGHLVNTWARLAGEFKDEPTVAGYDLLNEPNPGLRDPITAADQIRRYYQRAITAIRQAEWGWFGDPAADAANVDRFVDAMNEHRMGGAWWSWKQACRDPYAVGGGTTSKPQGNVNKIDCPSGRLIGLVDELARPLSRAYPRAAPAP